MERRTRGGGACNSEEEGKEIEENMFPIYSERSQQDMSAMVSALTQVIGGTDNNHPPHHLHGSSSIQNHIELSQQPAQQDQQGK